MPGGVWQVGREVPEKIGRSHIRNVLQWTGSWGWAWNRGMRADLHIRRSSWWPEPVKIRTQV